MGMLILEATGPNGEQLAMKAGDNREIPVGWADEFQSATFDADGIDDSELEQVIFEELTDLDPDWRSQLKPVE